MAGLRRKRAARKGEALIRGYEFPPHIERRVRRRYPQLDVAGWELTERGLREWFVCCAWRAGTLLGMPSRVVDEAWHEFILDSAAYTTFCDSAFGEYLHHTPDGEMPIGMSTALANTVEAWDRSSRGGSEESVLWDLDEQLGIPEPLGVSGLQLSAARAKADGNGGGGDLSGSGDTKSSDDGAGGSGGDGGGDGGGSGCGGGGCGGGS